MKYNFDNVFEMDDYYGILSKYKRMYWQNNLKPPADNEQRVYDLIIKLREVPTGKHFSTVEDFYAEAREDIDKQLGRETETVKPF
jgi:hypothetical protein